MNASFHIEAGKFVAALAEVSRVVEKRSTIPVLDCVKMRGLADGELIEMTGTDLERETNVQARAVAAYGDAFPPSLIEPHKLLKVLGTFPKDYMLKVSHRPAVAAVASVAAVPATDTTPAVEYVPAVRAKPAAVIFECDGTELEHVACGDRSSNLEAEDFPDLRFGDPCGTATFDIAELRDMLQRVSTAISTEETRYYLCGVCFETARVKRGGMVAKLTATDSHRLMHAAVDYDGPDASALKVILPRKTIGELLKAMAKRDGKVTVTWGDQQRRPKGSFYRSARKVRFHMAGYQLVTKVIDGTFPDYGPIIPKYFDKAVTLDRGRLETALKRVASCASERGRVARLVANGEISLANGTGSNSVKARVVLDGEKEGADFEIGFNTGYMSQMVESFRGDIRCDVQDAGSPMRVEGKADGGRIFGVLMPCKV